MVSVCSTSEHLIWLCDAPVDWSATGDFWSGIGTMLGAVAVIYAARKGASTFQQWKQQKLGERHIEQAERIMTAVDDARDALKSVRSPMMWAHEEEAAKKKLIEGDEAGFNSNTAARQKRLVTAQAYFERLQRTRDKMLALNQCRPMGRAFFGDEIEKAIGTLAHQFLVVQTYAEASIDHEERDDFGKKIWNALYYSDRNEDCEVTRATNESVATLEAKLLPILRA